MALDRPQRPVVDLCRLGMFVQGFKLPPMAVFVWTAMLLKLTLTAPAAVPADFGRAKAAYEREDYSVALSEFIPLAEQGHSGAQYYLARMHFLGRGVPLDRALAAQWFRKAAHQGHADAQNHLGLLYAIGWGVPLDHALAAQWYRKAADQGDADAQIHLGLLYAIGRGVPLDHALAAQWFRKAADQGDADAQYNLGLLYANGRGVPLDHALAAQWYRKAAHQGRADAQNHLGLLYANGRGVPLDHALAAQWYRKAAHQGRADAQNHLGLLYANGRGVPLDHALAAQWFRKAADQGQADAQYNLGLRYANGRGVPLDHALAAQWYRKAADQGQADAQYNLGVLYYDGEGVPLDHALAAQWFRKAADQGDADAQYNLGVLYANGWGVPLDHALAAQWHRKAADQGQANAQYNLGLRYYDGEGVPQDYVFAYAWMNLSAAQGVREARELRDKLRLAMTSGQIADAQALSREFQGRTERADTTTPPNRLGPARVERMPTGSGSGFLVGLGGEVLTNNHVVDGCAQLTVRHSGDRYDAMVRASDATNDLALLAAPKLSGNTAAFSGSPQAALGETATVAGYPFGGLLASDLHVTSGNISALAGLQDDSTRFQITAPVQPGNSGGPLLDESGNVIGVVVSRLNALGVARATGTIPQNVNFAIKGSVARMFLEIHGVPFGRAGGGKKLSTQAVAKLARGFTVAVECWE